MRVLPNHRLREALRNRMLVNFTRPFEAGSVSGYVLDMGPRFFLVAAVEDAIRFNGFQCFRLCDVRELHVPHQYAGFAEAALKKRRERMPKKPRVIVARIEALLASANKAFPLVTIHEERVDPTVCWIGRVLKVDRGRVSLLEISPDATWDERPNEHELREITRVDFGGDYENALCLVGGPAPGQQTEFREARQRRKPICRHRRDRV